MLVTDPSRLTCSECARGRRRHRIRREPRAKNGFFNSPEVHYKSATELISLLDEREIGARELLDHFLDRVERHNPAINAIIWQDADRARTEADASDRRRAAGEDTGPLDGLPVTVKESYDLAGSPTTWGVPEYSDNIADTDSAVVEKYRGVGAVVFGIVSRHVV